MPKWLWIVLWVGLGVALLFFWRLYALARQSQSMAPKGGIREGRLLPCEDSLHCVSSVRESVPAFVAPFDRGNETVEAWFARARTAVGKLGGTIGSEAPGYLHAEFKSSLFGFVDDLELRATDTSLVHVRSESRVGKSDLGANRKRVESLRDLLAR